MIAPLTPTLNSLLKSSRKKGKVLKKTQQNSVETNWRFDKRCLMTPVAPTRQGFNGSDRHNFFHPAFIVLALMGIVFIVGFSSALAQASGRAKLATVGTPSGGGAGQLSNPAGIATNLTGAGGVTAGDFYVADSGNNRISEFSSSGTFIRAWGIDVVESGGDNNGTTNFETCSPATSTPPDVCKAGTASGVAGGFSNPRGVAVEPIKGNVFVFDNSNQRVDIFSATGAFEGAFGWEVKAGVETAAALQFCTTAGTGCKAGSAVPFAGGFAATSATGGGSGLAFDPTTGHIYIADQGNLRIDEFTPLLNGSGEVINASFVRAFGGDVIAGGAEGEGNLVTGSKVINITKTNRKAFVTGQEVIASTGGIPSGTKILEIVSSQSFSQLKLSQAATETKTGVTITAAEGVGNVPRNERQAVTQNESISGNFKLKLSTTLPNTTITTSNVINTATALEVQEALTAPGKLPVGSVAVGSLNEHGGPWTIEFKGARFADTNVPQLATAPGTELADVSGSINIRTTVEGTSLEVCTAASGCQAGSIGAVGSGGWFSAGPIGVAVDAEGYVYAVNNGRAGGSCEANAPCSIEKFNPDGTFKENFGPAEGECRLTSTSGLALNEEPIAVAVDAGSQHVFVFKKTGSAKAGVCEFNSSGESLGPMSPAAGLDVSSSIPKAGLAVGTGEHIYVTDLGPVYILGPIPPPIVEILPSTEIGTTSARLNGKVTVPSPGGEGFNTIYHFEYSVDGGFHWSRVPIPDVSIGDGSAGGESNSCPAPKAMVCKVSAMATGLQPGGNYLVRLVGTTGSSATSMSTTFSTLPTPPSISRTIALPVSATTAKLTGFINPNNSPTTYHFEWGTDAEYPKYGNQAPSFEPFTGSGGLPVQVASAISNLQASTTYHFRIVATNAFGTESGPDVTFTTNACEGLNTLGLPDCRAFEQVSANDKRPVGRVGYINPEQLSFQAAVSGEAMFYSVLGGLGNATAGGEVRYLANRHGSSGWQSSQVTAPALIPFPSAVIRERAETDRIFYNSPDLSCGFLESYEPLADTPTLDVESGVFNLFRRNADATYTLITQPVPLNPHLTQPVIAFDGAAQDCDHVLFHTPYRYMSEAPLSGEGLYEWAHGSLRLAGILPDGSVALPTGVSGSPNNMNGAVAGNGEGSTFNSMALDGSRVFFTASSNEGGDVGKTAVFVRKGPGVASGTGDISTSSTIVTNINATVGTFSVGRTVTGTGISAGTRVISTPTPGTVVLSNPATITATSVALKATEVVDVSQSQTPTPNHGTSVYQLATPDGSHVYFLGDHGLTSTSSSTGTDLYDYNVNSNVLTDLSVDGNPTDSNGANVVGLLDSSDDGAYVYFAARGQLTSNQGNTEGQNLAGAGSFNVYLNHNGQISFVGLISASDTAGVKAGSDLASNFEDWVADATPDGRYLLFVSQANVTGYVSGGVREAYRYSAPSNVTVCMSCRMDSHSSSGNSKTSPIISKHLASETLRPFTYRPRSISEDGSRIFFTMPDVLASGAEEGKANVYEWERGNTYLLLKGERLGEAELTKYLDSSASGNDVFLSSKARLVPQDFDSTSDVYDLRVDGGLPYTLPASPCEVLLDKCQGPPKPPIIPENGPVTEGYSGSGNQPIGKPKGPRSHKARKHRKVHHKHEANNKKETTR